MDTEIEELKELVRRNIKVTEDTNRVVHGMRRAAWWATILRWAWWLIIFGVSGVAYYLYVQPYVERVQQAYTQVEHGAQQAADWQTRMNDFFKNIFDGQ
jgi:type II secretory pathway component PulM